MTQSYTSPLPKQGFILYLYSSLFQKHSAGPQGAPSLLSDRVEGSGPKLRTSPTPQTSLSSHSCIWAMADPGQAAARSHDSSGAPSRAMGP